MDNKVFLILIIILLGSASIKRNSLSDKLNKLDKKITNICKHISDKKICE